MNPAAMVTILIVDDYEDNRQMYAELLAYAGYTIVEARDGAEGIAKATEILPDLVVMDLSLPVIDGWEATRRLKRADRTRHIPILAITGHALDLSTDPSHPGKKVDEADGPICDGFLAKPCSPDRLLEMVALVLRRAQTAQSGIRKAAPRARPAGRRASGS